MGAALSTNRLSEFRHGQILSEFIPHSHRALEECLQIYQGSYVDSDADEDHAAAEGSASLGYSSYPRYITQQAFEEVFGMLVADSDPHFAFFQAGDSKTVCAPQAFCSIALLVKVDLHTKIAFLLRLYGDSRGQFFADSKRGLLKDFALALQRILKLSGPIPADVYSYLEKSFCSDDDTRVNTAREILDVCFTNARISGYLHEIQALVEAFGESQARARQRAYQQQKTPVSTEKSKALARSMSTLSFSNESILWTTRAQDYSHFWRQQNLELSCDTSCANTLQEMCHTNAKAVLAFDSKQGSLHEERTCLGLLSIQNFLEYFVHLIGIESGTTQGEYTRLQIERALELLGSATLRELLQFFCKSESRFQCVHEDEAYFNIILRFACGMDAVGVLFEYADPCCNFEGSLSVFDMLAWIQEDVSRLNGNAVYAVSSFPSFFYSPAVVDASTSSVCTALVEMHARKLTGIGIPTKLRTESKMLLSDHVCELFVKSFGWISRRAEGTSMSNFASPSSSLPLLWSLDSYAATLPATCAVSPDTTIARVIQTMIDNRTRRIVIRRSDGADVGIIRSTDIMVLLLHAQHCSHRDK